MRQRHRNDRCLGPLRIKEQWVPFMMNLMQSAAGKTYSVQNICTANQDLDNLLFLLGCRKGASISLISRWEDSCDIAVQGNRYNIENCLAEGIWITE